MKETFLKNWPKMATKDIVKYSCRISKDSLHNTYGTINRLNTSNVDVLFS